MTKKAQLVLDKIRKTHDTTELSSDLFSELCRAVVFYLKGGLSVATAARLVIEEVFEAQTCTTCKGSGEVDAPGITKDCCPLCDGAGVKN
jgi:Zn finger protein HypA/HybF involved in hydrogenase expression